MVSTAEPLNILVAYPTPSKDPSFFAVNLRTDVTCVQRDGRASSQIEREPAVSHLAVSTYKKSPCFSCATISEFVVGALRRFKKPLSVFRTTALPFLCSWPTAAPQSGRGRGRLMMCDLVRPNDWRSSRDYPKEQCHERCETVSKSMSPSRSIDVQSGATWRSRTVSIQPALPIVHGWTVRLVGRSIVLSPLVGPLEFGSLEHLKFISDLPPLIDEVQVQHADCVILAHKRTMMTLHCLLSTVFDPANHPSQH